MSTFQRPKELNDTLTVLLGSGIPSLLEIVVVWNNIGETVPDDFTSEGGVEVRFRASTRNSLNEKFLADSAYRTRAILLSDDDVYYKPADLEFAFQAWRKFGRSRITGALARCASVASGSQQWDYNFCEHGDVYSMVLNNLAFVDVAFLDFYSSTDPRLTKIRAHVDDVFNCEDIGLNFAISALTCSGPLRVRGRDPYVTYDPTQGLSRNPGHMDKRSHCLNHFADIFGFMPLVNETAYITLAHSDV